MMNKSTKKSIFTQSELKEIRLAVQKAESRTHGEFVPVFVSKSDSYEEALWRSGFAFALLSGIVLTVINALTDWLLWFPGHFWLLTVLSSGLLGVYLTMSIDSLCRVFTGKQALQEKAGMKAQLMFYTLGVFKTEQRIGIMIFLSFFEHQVIVLADEGINAVIPQEKWHEVVQLIVEKLKQNRKVEAVLAGIEACAKIVKQSPITLLPDEVNEIDNELKTDE
jgi:putative membrane protein